MTPENDEPRVLNLYTQLLQPLGDLPPDIIIIAVGILGYIPFDALLDKPVQSSVPFRDYPFLIRRHNFTHHYSSAQWSFAEKTRNTNNKLLAIAPYSILKKVTP